MKKTMLLAAALVAVMTAAAQEHRQIIFTLPDSIRNREFNGSDSLAKVSAWRPDYRTMSPLPLRSKDTTGSVMVIREENMPKRITVLNNNTLRLGPHFTISNGQVWNWGPYPNSYLDARTISVPLPR